MNFEKLLIFQSSIPPYLPPLCLLLVILGNISLKFLVQSQFEDIHLQSLILPKLANSKPTQTHDGLLLKKGSSTERLVQATSPNFVFLTAVSNHSQ